MTTSHMILPPVKPAFPPYVQYPGEISADQCRDIIALGEARNLLPGRVGNGADNVSVVNEKIRSVDTCVIPKEGAAWLYEMLAERIEWTNRDLFRFDLSGFYEGIQFLKYTDGDDAGFYNWHQDFGGGTSSLRKLSVVVQLSDPDDYEGCELHMFTDQEFGTPMQRGSIVIFPSWTPHRVTPITRGTRYALALWVGGPQFR